MLVAAFCTWHEHHEIALSALDKISRSLIPVSPVLVETYAVLTRLPAPHPIAPKSAFELINKNLRNAELVALRSAGYWKFLQNGADQGISGGRSCDALIAACAIQANVKALLTLNRRDFARLLPDGIVLECPLDEATENA